MSHQDLLLTWEETDTAASQLAAPMHAYLTQIATTLRPGSVRVADLALRCFAQFLLQQHPQVTTFADVCRIHDWDWPEAPPTVPILFGDLPRQEKPLPKALDVPHEREVPPADAAKLLRAAQGLKRQLGRVVCKVLIRTGLRVG